jgi:DNA-binding MarR family transcriptional regulator
MKLDAETAADAMLGSVRHLTRRLQRVQIRDDMTFAEREAMGLLLQNGPATSAELARLAQISPQAMGTTLAGLESRHLVQRGRDPHDGRRVVFSCTQEGARFVENSRGVRAGIVAETLAKHFTAAEIEVLAQAAPLLERLAQYI